MIFFLFNICFFDCFFCLSLFLLDLVLKLTHEIADVTRFEILSFESLFGLEFLLGFEFLLAHETIEIPEDTSGAGTQLAHLMMEFNCI